MKLFVITPIYATTTEGDGATPLVHYLTREWVKMGHEVTVFQFAAKFPRPYYWVAKLFQHQLNSRFGSLVPTRCPKEMDYCADGVNIHKRLFKKYKPHSEFSNSDIGKAISIINNEIEHIGVPDYFIGHWDSPNLRILPILKEMYNRPIALVFHLNEFNLEERYGNDVVNALKKIDVIGFRSPVAKADFEKKYFVPKRSFICYSGVSDAFVKAGEGISKNFCRPISKFMFTGSLIARKYASRLYDALCISCPQGDFSVKFIGDGTEISKIQQCYDERKMGNVEFTGRIPRESIIDHLKQAEVFAMISKGEIFGLVYLEAMALGLIPIGSRNEGIDGIIVDGQNGFLCEAGNTDELATIIEKIKKMDKLELQRLSTEAQKTAREFSDCNVAKKYLSELNIERKES